MSLAEAPPPVDCPLHLDARFTALWDAAFGAGTTPFDLVAGGAGMPLMRVRTRRGPSLSVRFDFRPADRAFLRETGRFRVIPIRLAAPRIGLEAGTLRGGIRGPVSARGALLDALGARGGWDQTILPVAARDAADWTAAARAARLPHLLRPTGRIFHYHDAAPDWDRLLAGASRNFRKNALKLDRHLVASGAEVRIFDQPGRLSEGFDLMAQVAGRSWKTGGGDAAVPVMVPYTARQAGFLRAVSTGFPTVVLVLLASDGMPVAAMNWFRHGDTLCAGVTFHAPEARSLAPGHALLQASFRHAQSAGLRRMDFNATDPWLADYADRTEPFLTLHLFPRSLRGRLLHALAAAADPGLPA